MDKCSFIFRGETLQDHGYVICDFSGSSSAGSVQTDSQRSFSSMSMRGGRRTPILYYRYDSGLIITFSICKDPVLNEQIIEPSDAAKIKRWLESPTTEKFRLTDEDYYDVFWEGTFNVEEYRFGGDIIGFNLTFNSVAPWGYKDSVAISGIAGTTGHEEYVTIDDNSDEEGFIYPDIKIKVLSAGNLTITNSFDNRATVIKNCSANEVITITHSLQIFTSKSTHNIYDDFNYKFVRINNKYNDVVNTLTFSLPCEYEISYNPIAKVVFS